MVPIFRTNQHDGYKTWITFAANAKATTRLTKIPSDMMTDMIVEAVSNRKEGFFPGA